MPVLVIVYLGLEITLFGAQAGPSWPDMILGGAADIMIAGGTPLFGDIDDG